MKEMDDIIRVAFLSIGLYIFVLLLVAADLWSGTRKAKRRNELRTSKRYRDTVNKLARYYNLLIALTFVDAMQIASLWYMDHFYEWNSPLFPFITLLGAIGIGFIEVKSIYEKAEEKVKNQYERVGMMMSAVVNHKNDPKKVAEEVVKYLKEKEDGQKSDNK